MSVGFSQARLARMHDVLARYVEPGEIPGVVALVSRGSETRVEVLGTKAAGGGDPMRRDTIFRISSMTKPITAVATMILVEECRLSLDEPVGRLLPELAEPKVLRSLDAPLGDTVPAQRGITIRDLLTLRLGSGLVFESDTYPIVQALEEAQLGLGMPTPATPPEPDEWMRRFGALPLMHQPGEGWRYNTGTELLAVLIARATGQPLETFLRERIFEPLGMKDTSFSVPPEKLDRFASSYVTTETGALELYDAPDDQWSRPPAFPSGSAGLVSTIDDYHAFARMMLGGGRYGSERILSRTSVELMTTDYITQEEKATAWPVLDDKIGWGFGIGVITRRENLSPSAGSFGWVGGLGTVWFSDPKEDLTGILMTQAAFSPSGPVAINDFWTSAYQALDD